MYSLPVLAIEVDELSSGHCFRLWLPLHWLLASAVFPSTRRQGLR